MQIRRTVERDRTIGEAYTPIYLALFLAAPFWTICEILYVTRQGQPPSMEAENDRSLLSLSPLWTYIHKWMIST